MKNEKKKITGVQEWACKSVNIQYGCENNCTYCYAKKMAARFGRIPTLGWDHPILKIERPLLPRNTTVMFPSTHDITPNNLTMAIQCINILLSRGNRVLIVSKPRIECINGIMENNNIANNRDRIEFRFTIGDWAEFDENRLEYEPNAPTMQERFICAKSTSYCFKYKTSISMEPLLQTDISWVEEMVACFESWGITEIWLGAMQYTKDAPKLDYAQLYETFRVDPRIKFKESFRKHLKENLIC